MRQATFIALGLALGIGLVITVTAVSAGVKNAQASVLKALYGLGTDLTVTRAPTPQTGPGTGSPPPGAITIGPGGACQQTASGKCQSVAGKTVDTLGSPALGALSASSVAAVAKLHDVTAAAGGLILTDLRTQFPKSFAGPASGPGGGPLVPSTLSVDGVDPAGRALGPLAAGSLTSGKTLTAAYARSNVAVLDSNYATANKLKVGSKITIAKTAFTVIGIVRQSQASSPPQVFIPLARAQALATGSGGKNMDGQVNTIYVAAASAADIAATAKEISTLLPNATVTSSASLASQVTGSVASTAKLANDLGRWLAVLVLIAAFSVAALLTMAAVSRRVPEFGTLKALGWRSRRITGQVMGESLATGIIGGLAGIGLGFGGAALVSALAPKLTATVPQATGGPVGGLSIASNGVTRHLGGAAPHTVSVVLTAPVTLGALALAVLLAVAGGLFAGSFGSWRAARLRPAAALAQVA
jgi:putative ABC transport system permease protein